MALNKHSLWNDVLEDVFLQVVCGWTDGGLVTLQTAELFHSFSWSDSSEGPWVQKGLHWTHGDTPHD